LHNIYNIYPKDKDGKDSSGADAIKFMNEEYPITNMLLQYREENKIISSFGERYIRENVKHDGRIHTSFNQIMRTGRISSSNPNIQQVKKNGGFRDAFVAPESKVIITNDYSSQEARVMADMAEDRAYIDFFLYGDGDAHAFVSTRMFSVAFGKEFIVTATNENKAYRQKGKTLNFAVSFGASAFTIAKRLKVTDKEAQDLIDLFFKGFPSLEKFFQTCREEGLRKGSIRTNSITNRVRWFPEHKRLLELQDKKYLIKAERSELQKIKGSIGRESQNTKIQGQWPCLNSVNSVKAATLIPSQDLLIYIINK
jgi:DNA polymerase-1